MPTLIILPGWGQSAKEWFSLNTEELPVPTEIIELPGFGGTPIIDDTWGVPEYAKYVEKLIHTLQVTEVILLGHSFGGRVAAYLASQQPPWLKALILYGAPCLYRPSIKTKILVKIAKMAKALGFSNKLSGNRELLEADRTGLGKIYRKAISFDQTAFLPKITVPTLLLWGQKDTEAPTKLAYEIHELVHHSKLEIIDNAGHNLHIQNQYIFYATLKNFLKNL